MNDQIDEGLSEYTLKHSQRNHENMRHYIAYEAH